MKRFILIVLDSVGVGELPDAHLYGDQGSNTLGNIAEAVNGLDLPNLQQLGLGNIITIKGVAPTSQPQAAWGKMAPVSPGKDTTTGHWELAGIQLKRPFPTFPTGFPDSLIQAFTEKIGRDILGNVVASGTEIIAQLGSKHIETGFPIVYTSADSVFQIAAHEEIVPVAQLYEWCLIARQLLQDELAVARVIARPFIGQPGNFVRTANRRDFSLPPIGYTVLDQLTEYQIPVTAVGKISDIFVGRGISQSVAAKDNQETIMNTIHLLKQETKGLIFANCVDFDMLWGHRNDYQSYAHGLMDFDGWLPNLLAELKSEDVLVIVADHGCDPTTPSTDHSREYVPLLVYGSQIKGINLGVRNTFADVAQSIAAFFGLPEIFPGTNFLDECKE